MATRSNEPAPKPITARQEAVAQLLACGRPVAAAARECRVNPATVWVWKRNPAFNAKVEELRHDLWDTLRGRLADAMASDVFDSLLELAKTAKGEAVRLDAQKAIYEMLMGTKSHDELKTQVEQLITDRRNGE